MSVNNSNSESSEATDELQATGPAHGPRLGLVRAEVESGGGGGDVEVGPIAWHTPTYHRARMSP